MEVNARRADLSNAEDSERVLFLLNEYACDPMGGGTPLIDYSQQNLLEALRNFPTTRVYLAFVSNESKAVGLAIGFTGFSTFMAKPLLNIHDFVVLPDHRGKKVATKLLQFIESDCRTQGYCKLTLEVLSNNVTAKKCYQSFGFAAYELTDEAGQALFWQKKLY